VSFDPVPFCKQVNNNTNQNNTVPTGVKNDPEMTKKVLNSLRDDQRKAILASMSELISQRDQAMLGAKEAEKKYTETQEELEKTKKMTESTNQQYTALTREHAKKFQQAAKAQGINLELSDCLSLIDETSSKMPGNMGRMSQLVSAACSMAELVGRSSQPMVSDPGVEEMMDRMACKKLTVTAHSALPRSTTTTTTSSSAQNTDDVDVRDIIAQAFS